MTRAAPGLFLVLGFPVIGMTAAVALAAAGWFALRRTELVLTPPGPMYGTAVRLLRRLAPRRWLTLGLVVLCVTALGLVIATLEVMFRGDLSRADRIAGEAAVVGGGGVVLAVLGGLVALAAYADSTRRPDLHLHLAGPRDGIGFAVRKVSSPTMLEKTIVINQAFRPALLAVAIENRADFSARNPSVRLEFFGVVARKEQREWVQVPTEGMADYALQWTGPIVQGNWTFQLPSVNLEAAIVKSMDAYIITKLVAEEFKPTGPPSRDSIQLVVV